MRKFICVLALAAVTGCDYTTPLVERSKQEIDPALVGLWQRPEGTKNQADSLLVLPLTRHEYLVSFPAGSPKSMFARATHCDVAGLRLMQLEWLGTGEAQLPEDNRVFQFVTYDLDNGHIAIRLLNPKRVNRNAGTAAALSQAITSNKNQADLFHQEMVFKRTPGK